MKKSRWDLRYELTMLETAIEHVGLAINEAIKLNAYDQQKTLHEISNSFRRMHAETTRKLQSTK